MVLWSLGAAGKLGIDGGFHAFGSSTRYTHIESRELTITQRQHTSFG